MIKHGGLLHWLIFVLFWSAGISSAVEVDSGNSTTNTVVNVFSRQIPTTAAVNDFSPAIPSCPSMYVYWERGDSAGATLYPADSDDDTVAEIEANTLIKAFTTNEFFGPFTPTKRFVRMVVDTINATTPSTYKIVCSNVAGGGGGVIGSGTLAQMNAFAGSKSAGDLWLATNNDSGDCSTAAGGGTTWCGWNGSGWESIGIAGGVDNLGNHTATMDLLLAGYKATNAGNVTIGGATKALEYDSTSACYYVDKNGNGTLDILGDADGTFEVDEVDRCLSDREIWAQNFASGSSTFGVQEAINHVCATVDTNEKSARGGIVNIPAGFHDLGTNVLTIPTLCRGIIIRGQGIGARHGGTNPSPGTILRFNLTGGLDAITFAATNQHWRVEDLIIQFSNQDANSRAISVGDQNDHWVIDGIYTTPQSADIETGAVIEMTNSQNFEIKNSRLEGFGTGIRVLGSDGDGGGRIHDNIIRGEDTTGTGQAGIWVSDGRPCSEITISDNVIETGNIGVEIGASTAGNGCFASISNNYFENVAGTNEVNVRASGYTAVSLVGNFFNPSSATPFRRTSSSLSGARDIFVGNHHLGAVVMDAGSCVVYGSTSGAGSLAACSSAAFPDRTTLPGFPITGDVIVVTNDPSVGSCTASGGSAISLCRRSAAGTWVGLGGGGINAVGTPVNNQVGVWTGAASIEGDANFTYNASTTTMAAPNVNGTVSVSSPTLTAGSTSGDGSIQIYNDDAGGDGLATFVTPINHTSTITTPAATSTLATLALAETLSNKTLASPVLSGTVSGADTIPSTVLSTEVRSMNFGASGLSVDGTNCGTPAEVTINSGPKLYTIICTDNDASTIYGHTSMPAGWDGNAVRFRHNYIQTAANTAALNGDIAAQCRGQGEAPSSTWGTEVAIDDAVLTGSNGNDWTESADVTPAGTCAAGDMLYWRWQLDAAGTAAAVATLHTLGFLMEYTTNVGD